MKNRIFFKLLAVFLIVIAATAAILDVTIGNAWEASLRNEVERNLTQRFLSIGRVHLVRAAIAELRRGFRGVAEWSVERGGKFS